MAIPAFRACALSLCLLLGACGGGNGNTGAPGATVLAGSVQRAAAQPPVAADYFDVLQHVYVGYFGRPADPAGLRFYANVTLAGDAPTDIVAMATAYNSNPAVKNLIDSFGTSQESQDLYPGDNGTFITAIYHNLFNREPDAAGKQFWVNAITSGAMTRASACLAIMAGARASDVDIINKKSTVAGNFAAALISPEQLAAYSGLSANVVVRTMLSAVDLDTDVNAFAPTIAATIAILQGSTTIALAGNGFVTLAGQDATEEIGANGLGNWTDPHTVTSVYVRVANAGSLTLALEGALNGASASQISASVAGTTFKLNLVGSQTKTYVAGTVTISEPGYVKVDLQGISKAGDYFGDIAALKITGTAITSGLVYANDSANYYWIRRGPSVNLGYTTPANTEYFYNEVTVPVGQDQIGSYFMSNGFSAGYLGMQVNSASERRILFSVWDPDSGGGKTSLVNKGPGVVDASFGGEGTGGQSYLLFNWRAGNTYKFLTRGRPDGLGNTLYTGWFLAPEIGSWRLMASWKRPGTSTYLTGNHSFLENFIDTNGYLGRKAAYGNQWSRTAAGVWSEVTQATLGGDAAASARQRLDFAGGIENGQFYLRNGGFFSPPVALGTTFTRPAAGANPQIDVNGLP